MKKLLLLLTVFAIFTISQSFKSAPANCPSVTTLTPTHMPTDCCVGGVIPDPTGNNQLGLACGGSIYITVTPSLGDISFDVNNIIGSNEAITIAGNCPFGNLVRFGTEFTFSPNATVISIEGNPMSEDFIYTNEKYYCLHFCFAGF